MEGSIPGKLRVWEGWAQALLEEGPAQAGGRPPQGLSHAPDLAQRLYAWEGFDPRVPSPRTDEGAEPYTLQWFLNIEQLRYRREGAWIPRLLEFGKHQGESLLGLGRGLGTDWLQYARQGASVIVCSPSAAELALTRRNFELRGLPGRFLHAAMNSLPLETASIDVLCLNSLLDPTAEPKAIIDEVYRVLKPGGKVLAVAPARYDLDYFARFLLPWRHWFGSRSQGQLRPAGYSVRGLRRLFNRFGDCRVHKRQLRRREVPHPWRWLPRPLLERLMGRVLVLKGFKPLSSAMSIQLAA